MLLNRDRFIMIIKSVAYHLPVNIGRFKAHINGDTAVIVNFLRQLFDKMLPAHQFKVTVWQHNIVVFYYFIITLMQMKLKCVILKITELIKVICQGWKNITFWWVYRGCCRYYIPELIMRHIAPRWLVISSAKRLKLSADSNESLKKSSSYQTNTSIFIDTSS